MKEGECLVLLRLEIFRMKALTNSLTTLDLLSARDAK
jgi:hypothetical protein